MPAKKPARKAAAKRPPVKPGPMRGLDSLDPESGDLPPGESHVEIRVGHSGAFFALPRAMRNLDRDQERIVAELQAIGSAKLALEDRFLDAVPAARAAGLSWSSIGFCLGVTGESLRKGFSE
jgi:hypothetical protein